MSNGTQARVATAAILIPLVIAGIWWGPVWLVASLAAAVAVVALLEFLALGEKMGFHTYRNWTCFVALCVFAQQLVASQAASISQLQSILFEARAPRITMELVLFVFVLGMAFILLGSQRPLGEILPGVSISCAGLMVVVLPFSA